VGRGSLMLSVVGHAFFSAVPSGRMDRGMKRLSGWRG
jgi:hypothetical protein